MTITENFPFDSCQSCNELILKVEEKVLFIDKHTQREIEVSCKNADLCRQLADRFGVKTDG